MRRRGFLSGPVMTLRLGPACATLGLLVFGAPGIVAPRAVLAQTSAPVQRARDLQAEVAERYRQGQYREAIPTAREALALREQALGPDHPAVAESLQSLADLLRETAEYAEARPLYERALAVREKALGPSHPAVATTLNGLGVLLFRVGDYAASRPMLERSLAIREKALGPTHNAVAASLQDLGLLLYTTGDYAAARPLLERALRIREQALGPSHPWLASTVMTLGRVYRDSGDYAAARPLLERALQIWERELGPAHPSVSNGLAHLGILLVLTGDYAGARPLFDRALKIREQAFGPDHPDVAWSLSDLGWLLQLTGDYAGARALYERALQIQERRLGPNHPGVAQALVNLATSQRTAGDYAAARPLLERALQVRERALGPAHPAVAGALQQLAYLLYVSGDYSAARPLYERALAIREAAQGPNHRDVASVLNDLGLLLTATGDLAGARRSYERAIRISEQALGADHIQLAWPLNNLGRLLRQMGDYAAARPVLERSLQIRERALGPNHPDVAASLLDLGYLLQVTRAYDAARPLYERALRIREQAFGPDHIQVTFALNSLGFLNLVTTRYADARPLYERALRIRERTLGPDHVDVAWSLNNLGALSRVVGDYDAAIPLYERALPTVRRVEIPDLRWRVTFGLARTYEQRGRLGDALPLYRESVATLEGLAGQFGDDALRTQYLQVENRLVPYEALARLLLKLHEGDSSKGYDRDAWAVLEAKKGRVVADALAAARPPLRDPAARQAAEQVQAKEKQARALERALREEQGTSPGDAGAKRVQNLTTLLAQTKAEYLAQVHAFLSRYPQYKAQFIDQQTVDPKALAKFADRLPAGTLAVQYFAAPDTLYLFVVAPGGRFQVKSRAVSQEDLYKLVKEYRRSLDAAATQRLPWADDGSSVYREKVSPLREVGRKLSGLLLEPVAGELRAHRNLVVIPNDLLLYLPIHALTLEGPDGSVRFLAETHLVSYVTQLELVDLLTPTSPEVNVPLLALANPDGSLPAASREVRELARIRSGATSLEGSQATKERFLNLVSQFSDIHLATHGVLDAERPERSYLLMAGADEVSQRLTVAEIASLSLGRNGLAVLSACETALGEQVPGAALITLAAAFSQAGAQSIVASLWKVNDAATRDFMVAFHRALSSGGRAAALQGAQLAVLREPRTAHPYYWAPFILIGAR
jgi:tetratricopeptide (TPR) repeat protein/CHAT domain-containing protein